MSGDSLRRITEGWGQQVEVERSREAERANAPAQVGESPRERRLEEVEPIAGQANLSTDGTMVLIRGEGWKEIKLAAVSEVHLTPAGQQAPTQGPSSRREQDPHVQLSRHSYQAGLWDAERMALHQYAEGLRRGIDRCQRLSSVNDGSPWIERITTTNFPEAVQILDWTHASQHVWIVANEVLGDQSPQAKQWAEAQLDRLWQGKVAETVQLLDSLDLDQERWPALVRQAPDYFRARQTQMRYDLFRAQGYPIGSGTVESGAKTVIHHRMRRPGPGWKRDNAQAMSAALSELHSGRFDRAWQASLLRAA